MIVGLLLVAAAAAGQPAEVTARLAGGDRVSWARGEEPVVLVLPKPGEGWVQLAARVTGSTTSMKRLKEGNPQLRAPLRGMRVRVPWELARGELRAAAVSALFPADARTPEGWEHVIAGPWGGEDESWWELAELLCGDGARYPALREANPDLGLYPPHGARVLIPEELLAPEFRRLPPTRTSSPRPTATSPSVVAAPSVVPVPVTARTPTAPVGARVVLQQGGDLEYRDTEAVYRLKPGEALYSAVVVRFTGQLHAADVNATAIELARRSGVDDVTKMPVGSPVRIPFELLLPEYLPAGDPRRKAWEKDRQELAAVKRAIRAANLDGIQVILDAGHGGTDSGATAGSVWESTYTYDVMARIKRVLEQETRATVWVTVQHANRQGPAEVDVLPRSREHRLLVLPPYDLSDSSTGVNLRWVLTNALLGRLEKQRVGAERVAFVSIHADSLHPAVRGMMVYVPSRALRPARGPSPAAVWDCREARETTAPRFSAAFRSRAEALSTQLGESIIRSAARSSIPVHPFQPVRSSVLRGGSRWVPAVLKYSRVPTSVLIEIGNLNNEQDREQLLTWRFREKLAHAIAAGLAEAFSR